MTSTIAPPGQARGFSKLSKEDQRAIASRGGRAAHERGTAHEWTPEEAKKAGREGGKKVSQDREHMRAIGRKGRQKRLDYTPTSDATVKFIETARHAPAPVDRQAVHD